jgi:hypothetical protein
MPVTIHEVLGGLGCPLLSRLVRQRVDGTPGDVGRLTGRPGPGMRSRRCTAAIRGTERDHDGDECRACHHAERLPGAVGALAGAGSVGVGQFEGEGEACP